MLQLQSDRGVQKHITSEKKYNMPKVSISFDKNVLFPVIIFSIFKVFSTEKEKSTESNGFWLFF